MIPSSKADTIIHYDSRCESGQFSDDGNFFFSCSQNYTVRMYNTSNPYHWKYYKSVDYPAHVGQWKITDASLSPDNKWLAYSSISSTVCLAATDPDNESQPYLLDFANGGVIGHRQIRNGRGRGDFGVRSLSLMLFIQLLTLFRFGPFGFQETVEKSLPVPPTIQSWYTTLKLLGLS